jgi:hypothetical protein
MPYTFKIAFPSDQRATLCSLTKLEADNIESALIALQADYWFTHPNGLGAVSE